MDYLPNYAVRQDWMLFGTLTVALGALSVGALLVGLIAADAMGIEARTSTARVAKGLKFAVGFAASALLFGTLSALTPSTSSAAIIYVVPAIANSKAVQKDAPEIYELAVKQIKKELSR